MTKSILKPVKVSQRDRKRLLKVVTGWNHLNELFMLESPSADELLKMIIVERDNNNRPAIIRRLVARLKSCMNEEVEKLLS